MTNIGIGLPGYSVADVSGSAEVASKYPFESFSVYGDLGDLPPYAVLHAVAGVLKGASIGRVGPMGVPVGMMHPEQTAMHAVALEEQLPGQSYAGLVRGAFLESIGERPAPLTRLEQTIKGIRLRAAARGLQIPIYVGGFGPRLLAVAQEEKVDGVKLGGSANHELARVVRNSIGGARLALGAVSVIDSDRNAARTRARHEVAKYLAVVGSLDTTVTGDDRESLHLFNSRFYEGASDAPAAISDSLLDKFAIAGTPDDALKQIALMEGVVDCFEFGTPHGLGGRPDAIRLIGESILNQKG